MEPNHEETQKALEESRKWREEQDKKVFCTSEEGCEYRDGVYCKDGTPDCVFAERQEAEHLEDYALGTVDPNAWRTGEEEVRTEPPTAVVQIAPGQDERVKVLLSEVMTARAFADERVIATEEDDKNATNDLVLMKNLEDTIKEKKEEYYRPAKDILNEIDDAFKLLSEPLAHAIKVTREKSTAYLLEQKRRQQEQEEINRKRMEAAEAEMKLKGELTESVNLVEVVEAPKHTRAELGTSGLMDVWKYEVTDFAALPDEYKVVDTAMLNSIAKKHHDQKEIPGVRFYNDPTLQSRRR